MMKRIAALVLTAAMIAAVSGCSAKTTETTDTSGAAVSTETKQEETAAKAEAGQADGEKV